jgi:ribosomal protein L16 Arg81 hydroxylase
LGPHDLQGVLAPVDAAEFLQGYWGRSFLYIEGASAKFSQLLPWEVLNGILEEHRLEPPRLRLTREGKPIPAASFVSHQTNRRKSGQPIPRLLATELTKQLRAGATLVLDAVDELHRPIRDLAESLERVFGVRIQVNAYAGWRTCHGFDLHWDDHDVFILQVAGKKHWKVCGMTRRYPLARDVEPALDVPEVPLWEGLLKQGDLLYIPRGWWHVATPLDEATLHLTVGINNPTGSDLLAWFVDRLKVSEDVRRDLPRFEGAEEQAAYLERLRQAFVDGWRPDLIQQYLSDANAKGHPRPHLNFPWSPTADVLPPAELPFTVKWIGTRPAMIEQNGDSDVIVATSGRRWRFAPAAVGLLELLLSGRSCSLRELEERGRGLGVGTIRLFLRELAENGLIGISSDAPDAS